MKKRIISLLLVLMMVMTLMPMAALADDPVTVAADTSWYTEAADDATEYQVSDANDLLGLAQLVNDGIESFAGKTVTLTADVDLEGIDWTPIGGDVYQYPSRSFAGTFNGNGQTIDNLKCTDLGTVINEAGVATHYPTAALFSTIYCAKIVSVNLTNVQITSSHYAGGIVAYCSDGGASEILNCSVIGGKIESVPEKIGDEWDNGDKVGGIAGYLAGDVVEACLVKNVVVRGYRDVGGVVGRMDGSIAEPVIYNCSTSNVVIDVNTVYNYKNFETIDSPNFNISEIANAGVAEDCSADTKFAGFTAQVGGVYYVDLHAAIEAALSMEKEAEETVCVEILSDIVLTGTEWESIAFNGAGHVAINGNGCTITGLNAPLFDTCNSGAGVDSSLVIRDLTIDGANIVKPTPANPSIGVGAFINYIHAMQYVELNNCQLVNSTISDYSGARVGGLIGWDAGYDNVNDGAVETTVSIYSCRVYNCNITANGSVGGMIGHAGANPWTNNYVYWPDVENCTLISFDDSYRVGAIVGTAECGFVDIGGAYYEYDNNIAQLNGTTPIVRPEGQSNLYGRFVPGETGKLRINGELVHDHNVSETPTVYEPTCVNDGYSVYCCTDPDCFYAEYIEGSEVPATGKHVYEDGYCKWCGKEEPAPAPVTPSRPTHTHSYTATVVAPTCTEQGYTLHKCSCGASYKDTYVKAAGHTTELQNAKAATCTEVGYSGDKVCTVCKQTIEKGKELKALGHDYKDGVCIRCEAKDPNAPVEHQHSYTDVVTAPTCLEKGFTTHTCACGDVKVDTYVDALGHDFKNGVCSRCGAKDVTFNPFKDVDKTTHSDYYDAILWAYYNDITKGTNAAGDMFSPELGCTRAQIVTFLWRQSGAPVVEVANPFADVDKDKHADYYNAILWGYSTGVIKGVSDTEFDPDRICTRAEIVTMLYRLDGENAVKTGTQFTDLTQNWYKDAIAWAVAEGITKGTSDTTFTPDAPCTRAQTVTFLYRYFA